MRHCYRKERIKTVKMNRRQPNRLILCFLEFGVVRVIDPACNDELSAGEPQLLFPSAIKINQTVDCGHLLKELSVVRTTLFNCGGTGSRGPANLSFDIR